ncbi:MAG: glycosyltransferase [Planctomycetaceae bacterium]|jgi:glycosyltransferase involved in cell wall biosynthesis|nr:glycosyltransferase [Planctomycetaceae bacterium]
MRLVLATEYRLVQSKNGNIYSLDGSLTNRLVEERYLRVFDHVSLLARVTNLSDIDIVNSQQINGDRVSVIPLPYYIGPWQYLKVRSKIIQIINEITVFGKAYICRCPGMIASHLVDVLSRKNIPYGVEVVGDPYDIFASGTVKHIFRPYFRYHFSKKLKRIVKGSVATIYVTKKYLQKRYPVTKNKFAINATNAALSSEFFAEKAKQQIVASEFSLLSIGSLDQMYKAPDIVLRALAKLKQQGINCRLTWLGDGRYIENMKSLASKLRISEQINFPGNIRTREEVCHFLDQCDLYLMVSRTEGLPRALLEAMARGLPCIGSRVGGIPELLDDVALIPSNDVEALTEKIKYFISNKNLYEDQAKRNLKIAHEYEESILTEKRNLFYQTLMDKSI